MSRLGVLHEASTVLSHKIIDAKHHKVGKVENVLVDLESGQALAVLVSVRAGLVCIPAPLVVIVSANGLELRIEKDAIERSPILKLGAKEAPAISQVEECFTHFGQALAVSGKPQLVSALLGARLANPAGNSLGTVKDAMVDLPLGKVVYVVVDAGQEAYLYPVPAPCVNLDGGQARLRLDRDRKWVLSGPHFDRAFWSQMAMADLATAVQRYYAVETKAPVTLTFREPAAAPAPAESRSESAIIQAVLAEIYKDPTDFKNVNLTVTASNGRVTLNGTVRSESQARKVVAAAERVVGRGAVIDNLQFRGKARAANLESRSAVLSAQAGGTGRSPGPGSPGPGQP